MRNEKILSLFLVMALILTTLVGCGKTQTTPVSEDTTFTVALSSDIISLDPAFAYDFTTNQVVNQITEGLLTFDSNNQLVPLLAKDWKAVNDTTYVYTIRDDVCFSDGTPMTMDDVLFSLERTKDPATGSYVQWMFGSVDSITKTGDWELTVKLKQPSATWQYVFGTTAGHIISKAYYETNKAKFGTAEGGILGTGAFKYDSWKNGQEVVLTKNDKYWDKDVKSDLAKLIFKIIPEDTTRVTALQTGQVDFTAEPPLDMMETLEADTNLNVDGVETMGLSFLAFNTQRAPFNDVNVRKAIYHAIDMQAIHDNIVKSAGIQGTVLPNGSALYTIEPDRWNSYLEKAPVYEYSLDKAKEYMAKSSVPEGFDCNLLTTESSLRYSEALAIQEALKAININVELVKLSSDEHTNYQFGGVMDANGKRDYDMILAGWEADYPDISGNIEPLFASANAGADGANAAAYVNPEVDKLIAAQAASTNPTERNDLVFQALDIITNEVPYIFVDYPIKQTVLNEKFTGFTMNASWLWNLYFKNICLKA
ncbi:MAG: ABC transporter substrate-binding protein [Clostridiaceae bacterium]